MIRIVVVFVKLMFPFDLVQFRHKFIVFGMVLDPKFKELQLIESDKKNDNMVHVEQAWLEVQFSDHRMFTF